MPQARNIIALVKDMTLIGAFWLLLIGVLVHPAAQLVGLIVCAIALYAGAGRHDRKLVPVEAVRRQPQPVR
jgi:hypothetical protein